MNDFPITFILTYITLVHILVPFVCYILTPPNYNVYSKQTYILYGIGTWACLIITTFTSYYLFNRIQTTNYNLFGELFRTIIFAVLFDFWFYFTHRLAHAIPYIYQNYHKFHHKAINPTPYDGLMVDPIEGFFLTNFPAAIMIHFLQFHIITYCFIILLGHILVFINHSSYDKRHIKHHETSIHNYGAFVLSDWIMKTNYTHSKN